MLIQLNGADHPIPEGTTMQALIEGLDLAGRRVFDGIVPFIPGARRTFTDVAADRELILRPDADAPVPVPAPELTR